MFKLTTLTLKLAIPLGVACAISMPAEGAAVRALLARVPARRLEEATSLVLTNWSDSTIGCVSATALKGLETTYSILSYRGGGRGWRPRRL